MVETLRVDSPLGSWTQANWSPPPGDELEGIVETIWDFGGTLVCRREQTFPSGLLELVVQLDEPHRPIQPAARESFPAVCVDGLRTTATIIEGPSNRCRVLGMRLHPLGAFGILSSSVRSEFSVARCAS